MSDAEITAPGPSATGPAGPEQGPRAGPDPGVARLWVELRLLGVMGLAWNFAFLHAGLWAFATLGFGGPLSRLPWGLILGAYVVGAIVAGAVLFGDLPRRRWPRADPSNTGPPPWPLLAAGFPLTAVAPLYVRRHARERRNSPPGDAFVEPAFHLLLRLPRAIGLKYLAALSAVMVIEAVVLGNAAHWSRDGIITMTILWLALAGPVTAVLIGWARAIVRPEYLSAPRTLDRFHRTAELRVRLMVNAMIASAGVIVAPLCVGYLWVTSHRPVDPRARVGLVAERMVDLAHEGSLAELGHLLDQHPKVTVWIGTRVYGVMNTEPPATSALEDLDEDGVADRLSIRSGHVAVQTPLPAPRSPLAPPLILGAIAAVLASFGAVVLLARDVERDVTRASGQAEAVATGEAPAPLHEETFATVELRELVATVDRLVQRITDANVAKYVAIEKAKEADRLKSQFLANMSHDLRSPLISILGFSELLLTGIDGELRPEQREMVEPIQASGRALLQQIDDILDTAKIDAGRLDIHPEPTPPTTLVNRAIHAAKKRQRHDVDFVVDVAPGLPPAFVDPYRTVQAIENVLLFASERVHGGRITISVSAGRTQRGRMITIEVHTPVAPATVEQLARARRGFFRIPGHHGLGLGLPIAGSILELQGGTLDLEERGEGMTFTLRVVSPEVRRERPVREVT